MDSDGPRTAEILLGTPEVAVEEADDDTDPTVTLSGTMFHDGLNANAWGMTEAGAEAIASSLRREDLTAGHPMAFGYGFTRSIHDGPGKPIGTVDSTEVTTVDEAVMAEVGGNFTADYRASVSSRRYADDFRNGLMVDGDYGVSVGIAADEEDAVCSVCGDEFAECDHARFDIVDGQAAGPLYTDGEADHLAVVYVPAYENADIEEVSGREMIATDADQFFGQPFDEKGSRDRTNQTPEVARDEDFQVAVNREPQFTLQL